MGGDIASKSEFGKGSIFSIELPYNEFDGNVEEYKELPSIQEDGSLSTRRLFKQVISDFTPITEPGNTIALIVEDSPFNLLVMESMLRSLKIRSDKAENGKVAIDLVKQRSYACPYSLIFMDINMPTMNGIEVIKYIFFVSK
jgi:PleD family two-component response regulator